jgi:dihydrodipicolinate synthase/N-acetylneuraminate lyase
MNTLEPGVYPAAVTPMDASGQVDGPSVARLLAYFEAAGCKGVVLAGTNGEGPSLSAVEKRDLLRLASGCAGSLELVLGIATPSLDEAKWSCDQAGKNGATAVLVMPPAYFRTATEEGIAEWFEQLADGSPVPVLAYNFPRMTGFTMSQSFVARLASHPNIAGFKDSSGEAANLAAYRAASDSPLPSGGEGSGVRGKRLFVGDETLLLQALAKGWIGTISGAANCVPQWLSQIVAERDETKFHILLPVIKAIRAQSQPAANKAVLHALGVIATPHPRLPLKAVDPTPILQAMETHLGITRDKLAL